MVRVKNIQGKWHFTPVGGHMVQARHSDVIVIGGGVIGIACAYYLSKSGRQVRVIEKDTVGSGASHGNCGLVYISDLLPLCSPGSVKKEFIRILKGTSPLYIAPRPDLSLLLWLIRFGEKCNARHLTNAIKARYSLLEHSKRLYDALFSQEDLPCDYENKGVLTVFKEAVNMEKHHTASALLEPFGLSGQYVEKKELGMLEPAVGEQVAGAWFNPVDRHLRPDRLMTGWKNIVMGEGVSVHENCSVTRLVLGNKTVKSVKTETGDYTADHFVLASGAWSPMLSRPLGVKLPIQPGKGYSITMERPGICPEIPCYLYEKSVVATPWKSGYRLGGTMEFSGFNKTLYKNRLGNLRKAAKAYMKTPEGRPITEEWVGIRPMSCDDLPIIDRTPGFDNFYIAAGHGMMGVSMATATGSLISNMINHIPVGYDTRPFSIKRF